jgi:3-hydroxyacyl-CoA dehydrogenase
MAAADRLESVTGESRRSERAREGFVEVKIGVQHANRELVLESEQSPEEVEKAVADALAGKSNLLQLTDEKGRKVLIPADRLAYVEIGEVSIRKVGFGAI